MPVQFIKLDGGDELAVLPRQEYERLVEDAEEDRGMARLIDRASTGLAEGREITLPIDVADAIADGQSRLRVLRKWRGLSQAQLAATAGVGQSYLSDLESGRRVGAAATLNELARALGVPLDLLVD